MPVNSNPQHLLKKSRHDHRDLRVAGRDRQFSGVYKSVSLAETASFGFMKDPHLKGIM